MARTLPNSKQNPEAKTSDNYVEGPAISVREAAADRAVYRSGLAAEAVAASTSDAGLLQGNRAKEALQSGAVDF